MTAPTVPPVSTRGIPTPYLMLAELKRSPIYTQLEQLNPDSTDADRDAELTRIIARVSAMINGEVNQNLAATVDNEVGRVVVSDYGDLRIHTRCNPIVQVNSISLGVNPTTLVPVTNTVLTQMVLDPWRITLPAGTHGYRPGARLWAQWSYINGFPVTYSTANTTAGATSITVNDATGILPNETLMTIEDGRWLEMVVPTAVTGNVLTVPAMQFAHQAGVGVTALPDDIKEAALVLISRLHDTWSLSMGAITLDGSGAKVPGAKVVRAMCDAAWMLAPYKRIW